MLITDSGFMIQLELQLYHFEIFYDLSQILNLQKRLLILLLFVPDQISLSVYLLLGR